jgi:hypothetical protein
VVPGLGSISFAPQHTFKDLPKGYVCKDLLKDSFAYWLCDPPINVRYVLNQVHKASV